MFLYSILNFINKKPIRIVDYVANCEKQKDGHFSPHRSFFEKSKDKKALGKYNNILELFNHNKQIKNTLSGFAWCFSEDSNECS